MLPLILLVSTTSRDKFSFNFFKFSDLFCDVLWHLHGLEHTDIRTARITYGIAFEYRCRRRQNKSQKLSKDLPIISFLIRQKTHLPMNVHV